MSITLLASPDEYALTAGGRMNAEFSLNGRVISAGTKARNSLSIFGATTNGQKVALRWNNQIVELIFKTQPVEPHELPVGNGGTAYLETLLPLVANYFPLREDFTGFRVGTAADLVPGIYFEAKQPGAVYSIDAVALNTPIGLTVGIGNQLKGADAKFRPRYSAYIEIWLQPAGGTLDRNTFERVAAMPVEVKASGRASLDVGKILHPLLGDDIPSLNGATPTRSSQSARAYFLAYAEASGSPIRPGRVTQSAIYYAYKGGADYAHRAAEGYNLLDAIAGNNATDEAALRAGARNSTRYVTPDSIQFLSFLNHRKSQQNARVYIYLTLDNGTVLVDDHGQFTPWSIGEKLTVPTGPQQLDVTRLVPAGRSLKEYKIYVVGDQGERLTAEYRYIIDYAYRPYRRQFLYINSLGCPETLTTFGKGNDEWQRFGELAEVPLAASYKLEDGGFSEYAISIQQQTSVTTGFRSRAELRGWIDFYRTAARFHLKTAANGLWQALPVSINTKAIKEAKDGDILFAHSFTYVYRFTDAYFIDDEDEADQLPPPNFQPQGQVIVTQATVLRNLDPTIPAIVRTLQVGDILDFKQSTAWGNHREAGYMDQQQADSRYPTIEANNLVAQQVNASLEGLKTELQIDKQITVRAVPKSV